MSNGDFMEKYRAVVVKIFFCLMAIELLLFPVGYLVRGDVLNFPDFIVQKESVVKSQDSSSSTGNNEKNEYKVMLITPTFKKIKIPD